MKIPAIKKLVQQYDEATLAAAEQAIEAGEPLAIEVEGEDEGEQLTHVIAARWILDKMNKEGMDFTSAMRAYAQMVRNSIS